MKRVKITPSMKKVKKESVLDLPQEGLCQDVWQQDFDGTWYMRPEVQAQLSQIFTQLCEDVKLSTQNLAVNITGSITSNTYTASADIDMHLHFVDGFAIRQVDEMTQSMFRNAYERLKEAQPDLCHVGSHPIEVYFQPNEMQDHMSIGCYDLFEEKWLVGPELKAADYNPWKELYDDAKNQAKFLMKDIRNIILECYEKATAILQASKANDKTLTGKMLADLKTSLEEAKEIFLAAKEMRHAYSSPKTEKQAEKWRKSRKWQTADAAFKLMDKYGYLYALRLYTQSANDVTLETAQYIADTIVLDNTKRK